MRLELSTRDAPPALGEGPAFCSCSAAATSKELAPSSRAHGRRAWVPAGALAARPRTGRRRLPRARGEAQDPAQARAGGNSRREAAARKRPRPLLPPPAPPPKDETGLDPSCSSRQVEPERGSRRPHLVVSFRPPQGCSPRTRPRGPPGAHRARPRRPLSAPQSRVRRRPQSGAGAEAILCGGAGPEGGCTGLPSRAGPPGAPGPASPAPGRVWWRPRRRAPPGSGPAVTRAALAPPRATSPAPRAGRALPAKQRGLGTPWGPARAPWGCRAQGGGGGHKAAFVAPRPARGSRRNRPRPQRRPGPHGTRRPGLGRTRKPVPPAANRPPPRRRPRR